MYASLKRIIRRNILPVVVVSLALPMARGLSQANSQKDKPAVPEQKKSAPGDNGISVEVLSTVDGWDPATYLKPLFENIKSHWYPLIPQSAKAPTFKKGVVSIAFSIQKDGNIKDLGIAESSGDPELDRAALEGIRATPFELPKGIKEEHLMLKVNFFYNHEKRKARPQPSEQKKQAR